MVRDGPSGLLTMRLRSGQGLILSLSKDEEDWRPVSKPQRYRIPRPELAWLLRPREGASVEIPKVTKRENIVHD
jgi:hypothetical protein